MIAALGLLVFLQDDPGLPKVPTDWKVEVVAKFPDVRHPTVVACSPDGRVFVGEDPQDMEGPVDRPIGRVVCIHPDGKVTVFAENLGVVFGLQVLDGRVYIHHCPRLTVYRDENGVGKEPRDLIACTHPEPWKTNRYNTHIPAGFKLAMDGFFYMAVGDKGIFGAVGSDGTRLDLRGGGVLRLRPDATGLEVFCTGTRNFTDVAIDAEDGIFAWDNDDNVRWGARVLHLVESGDYGYPWDFEKPYALGAMGDGRGIPAGGEAYEEDALPEEYRGNLFFCEWGRSQIVRFRLAPQGATRKIVSREPLFVRGGEEFRPVGIAVAPDGSGFYVADWNTARRLVKDNAGRVLKFTWTGRSHAAPRPAWSGAESVEDLLAALDHPARSVRMTAQRRLAGRRAVDALTHTVADATRPVRARIHALWALEGGPAILAAARAPQPELRRHAIRHLGTRHVKDEADLFAAALRDPDASVRLQAATALGRIRQGVAPLQGALADEDPVVRHAAFTALRRTGAWEAIGIGLRSPSAAVREGSLFALRESFEVPVVTILAAASADAAVDERTRAGALEVLAELHRKDPVWDGSWWGTRPSLNRRPARSVDYEGTPIAFAALRSALGDSKAGVRRAAIEGLRVAGDPKAVAPLRERFAAEGELRLLILRALEALGDPGLPVLAEEILKGEADPSLMASAARFAKDPQVLAEALRRDLPAEVLAAILDGTPPADGVRARLSHPDAGVASRAARALGRIASLESAHRLRNALTDLRPEVRRASADALGALKARDAVDDLLKLRGDAECRLSALAALAAMPDARAVEAYLDGIGERNPDVRTACRRALAELGTWALLGVERLVPSLPEGVVAELQRLYADRPSSAIHRRVVKKLEPPAYEAFALAAAGDPARGKALFSDARILACGRCHVIGREGGDIGPDLSIAGAIYGRAYLVESILYPSRIVAGGYRQAMVQTKSGAIHVGLPKRETPAELLLQDADGTIRAFRKDDLAARKTSATSIMPEGLIGGLSLQEFADLVAYLETLKGQEALGPAGPDEIDLKRGEGRVVASLGGKPVATYVFDDKAILRPYFAHVAGPSGTPLTRAHPPVPGKDATDHATMHPGIWLGFGDLGGADFWRNKGRVEHARFAAEPAAGSFTVVNRYVAGDRTVCEETCRVTFLARPAGILLILDSAYSSDAEFAFGDQEEMGLGVRLATPLTVKGGGRMVDSEGRVNEAKIWGNEADWCDYGGVAGGRRAGLLVMPDPANFRRSWMHARDYGVLVANPFGRKSFRKGDASRVVVRKGESFRLRFGILLHDGPESDPFDPKAAYEDFLRQLK